MLQGEHSAILSTFIKLPFVIKISVLSIFEWPLYTGLTVPIKTPIKPPDRTNQIFFKYGLKIVTCPSTSLKHQQLRKNAKFINRGSYLSAHILLTLCNIRKSVNH